MMQVGDEMIWMHTPRDRWCFVQHLPCTIMRIGPGWVTIEIEKLNGERVLRVVKPESLKEKR